MKCWVAILKNTDDNYNNNYFEFEQVECKCLTDAIFEVEKGYSVVSPYFKKIYPKYKKMWEYINKRYDKIMRENIVDDIDSMCEIHNVGCHRLYFDAIMYSKHNIYIDTGDVYDVEITDLSDYNLEQLMLYLTSVYDYVKGIKI